MAGGVWVACDAVGLACGRVIPVPRWCRRVEVRDGPGGPRVYLDGADAEAVAASPEEAPTLPAIGRTAAGHPRSAPEDDADVFGWIIGRLGGEE